MNLLDKTHKVQTLQEQIDKLDITVETFCMAKDTVNKVNKSVTEDEAE